MHKKQLFILFSAFLFVFCSGETRSNASDYKSEYIRSILGQNPNLKDVFSFKDGKFVKKIDVIKIRIVNPPNDKIGLFALSNILNYVDALRLDASLWSQKDASGPNEVVVFDDFFDSENNFKKENFAKYGVTMNSDRNSDPQAPNCFTIRDIKSGIITRAMSFIDSKLGDDQTRDCIVRDIGFSFGVQLYSSQNFSSKDYKAFDEFSREFGPYLAEKREECTSRGSETLDYSCLTEK